MKPMLADDWDPAKVRFPVIAQPKIDGVRGLNMNGSLTGRSLKPFKNKFTTKLYSQVCLMGLDGEFAAGPETSADLCRVTSSAVSTIEREPFTLWWLFDYITQDTASLPYILRYRSLDYRIKHLQEHDVCRAAAHLRIVPYRLCEDMDELMECHEGWTNKGYEGTCFRDPDGRHKQGRSTVREGGLIRIKDFVDAEAEVVEYLEGNQNGNEAQTNELGKTFRSSHQENMIPNAQVGTIVARVLRTEFGLTAGQIIHVSPSEMDIPTRRHEWFNREKAPGRIFTFKHFPKGVKDKPRFPGWKFWRDSVDISP